MIGFGVSFLAWLASTVAPTFVGLVTITWANRFVKAKYLAAFALGIFLWFFVDIVQTSANLDVNFGFSGGGAQVALVILFLGGSLFLVWADRHHHIFSPEAAIGKYGLLIPVIVALAIGIHGLGEGAAYSATVFNTSSGNLVDAFGGLYPAVAYVLHKGLEPMMIGACYCVYVKRGTISVADRLGDIFLLTIVFVLPSLIGAAIGYYIIYNTTYYFALGAGSSIYAGLRLAGPLFGTQLGTKEDGALRVTLSIILGFMALYGATLFHG